MILHVLNKYNHKTQYKYYNVIQSNMPNHIVHLDNSQEGV